MALNFSYMAFQLIIYISDHSVWWMHRGWRKGLAYDTFCLFWMWQTTWRSALYYARRPALLFGLFWLHVCWILWCLWRNYWSGPRPDDPWRPALARHWQLFLLSSLSNIIIGPAFFAKTWPYLLFGVLFQRRIFNGQKQVRQRLLLLFFFWTIIRIKFFNISFSKLYHFFEVFQPFRSCWKISIFFVML